MEIDAVGVDRNPNFRRLVGLEEPDIRHRAGNRLMVEKRGGGFAVIEAVAEPALRCGKRTPGDVLGNAAGGRGHQPDTQASLGVPEEKALGEVEGCRQGAIGVPVPLRGESPGAEGDEPIQHDPTEIREVHDDPAPIGRSGVSVQSEYTVTPGNGAVVISMERDATRFGENGTGALAGRLIIKQEDIVRVGTGKIIAPGSGCVSVATIVHQEVPGPEGEGEGEVIGVIMIGAAGTGVEEAPVVIRGISKHRLPGPREVHGVRRGKPGQGGRVAAEEAGVGLPVGVVVERVEAGGRGDLPHVNPKPFEARSPERDQLVTVGGTKRVEELLVVEGDDALIMAGKLFV